jgi:hypothetical protein
MVSNYNIYWALDIQDQNTLMLLTEGFFAITSPISTINKDFVMIKTSRKFHCLFNGTKTSLTTVEEILKQLAKVVDGLTGILKGNKIWRAN